MISKEEVCKALSEWGTKNDEFNRVWISEHTIYTDDGILCYLSKNNNLMLSWDLPPNLITMIGRFYEGEMKDE